MAPQESFPEFDVHKTKAGGFAATPEKRRRVEISIDGRKVEAFEDEPLIEAINRSGQKLPQVCYHPQLGPIQTCDTCMVEVDGTLVRACAHRAVRRHASGHQLRRRAGRATRGLRPDSRQPPALLHGLRQQQRQLHGPQHHRSARRRAPGNPFPAEALTQVDSPIRSTATIRISASCAAVAWKPARTFRSMRPSRSAGRIRTTAGVVGRRCADRRVELCLLRPLCHRVPVQRPDGEIHDRACRILHRVAKTTLTP